MQYMQRTLLMVSINCLKIKLHNGTQHTHNTEIYEYSISILAHNLHI